MVEKELSSISQMYLRHPVWAKRITVLIGSPLKSSDLARARAHVSLSCFIHTPRDKGDGIEAVSTSPPPPRGTAVSDLYIHYTHAHIRTITPSCVLGLSRTLHPRSNCMYKSSILTIDCILLTWQILLCVKENYAALCWLPIPYAQESAL